ncbi:MAG: metallophosphoesterase family protein [Sneathiellaceae bacterium]
MFKRLRKQAVRQRSEGLETRPDGRARSVPPGRRVYAIGDIHGRSDLLDRLHEMIREDARKAEEAKRTIVYLGDLVDRGMDSRGVVEQLLDGPPDGFDAVYVLGNHEAAMLDFLEDSSIGPHWMVNGGDMTLYSYGVAVPRSANAGSPEFVEARKSLIEKLPAEHLRFLKSMVLAHEVGDYLFVHAGIRPGVPMAEQDPQDLLWIREPFLSSTADLGQVVVHGHTISTEVEERSNRIGIDTGAYHSGRLTSLVLSGAGRRYLQT